jgi:hypothetical protein
MRCHVASFSCAIAALVGALNLAAVPQCALAAPVAYSESTHGELSAGGTLITLPFEEGVNTIAGALSNAFFIDFDSFAFTVPDGFEVQSASVMIEDSLLDFGDYRTVSWALYAGSDMFGNGALLQNVVAPVPSETEISVVPLPAGLYNLSQYGFDADANALADYTFTFVVTPVPEPAALALPALAAAMLCRRRRR